MAAASAATSAKVKAEMVAMVQKVLVEAATENVAALTMIRAVTKIIC
jgi:hypothetical protein